MLCIYLSLGIVIIGGDQPSEVQPSEVQQISADIAIIQCLDNIERLRSGVCRIRIVRKEHGVDVDSADIATAFDSDSLRFDRLRGYEGGIVQGGRYIRTGDKSYEILGQDGTTIMRDDASAASHSAINPFDVRALGTFTLNMNGPRSNVIKFLGNLHKKLDFAVNRQGSLTQFTWRQTTAENQSIDRELWLDADQGNNWVRFRSDSELMGFDTDLETSWKEQNGVYVPVSLKETHKTAMILRESLVTVDWESVNKPVDPAMFTPEGLAGKEVFAMYSNELGKPVFVKEVGKKAVVTGVVQASGTSWRLLLGVNAVVLGGLLAAYLVFRKLNRSNDQSNTGR